MNKFFAVVGALFALSFGMVAPAHAEQYVRASVGSSVGADAEGISLGDGTALRGAVGTQVLLPNLRVELQAGRVTHDTNFFGTDVTAHATQLGVEAFWDFDVGSKIVPYVGVGFTRTNAEVGLPIYSIRGTGNGYNIDAGIGYRVNDKVTLDLGVRRDTVDLEFDGVSQDVSFEDYSVNAGVRFAF